MWAAWREGVENVPSLLSAMNAHVSHFMASTVPENQCHWLLFRALQYENSVLVCTNNNVHFKCPAVSNFCDEGIVQVPAAVRTTIADPLHCTFSTQEHERICFYLHASNVPKHLTCPSLDVLRREVNTNKVYALEEAVRSAAALAYDEREGHAQDRRDAWHDRDMGNADFSHEGRRHEHDVSSADKIRSGREGRAATERAALAEESVMYSDMGSATRRPDDNVYNEGLDTRDLPHAASEEHRAMTADDNDDIYGDIGHNTAVPQDDDNVDHDGPPRESAMVAEDALYNDPKDDMGPGDTSGYGDAMSDIVDKDPAHVDEQPDEEMSIVAGVADIEAGADVAEGQGAEGQRADVAAEADKGDASESEAPQASTRQKRKAPAKTTLTRKRRGRES